MAATLMYIKSRELLPVEKQIDPVEEDDGDDPRWELIRQLVAYKKFKDAAAQMQQLEDIQENTYPRMPVKPVLEPETASHRPDASLFDLINAVNTVLQRLNKREDLKDIFEERWTVSEKIEMLMRLTDEQPSVSFLTLFSSATTRHEVVVTFMALLELIRLHQLAVVQLEPFGEITIAKATAATLAPAVSETPESSIAEESKPVTGDLFSQPPPQVPPSEQPTPSGDANPAH
jgi:segregation and condensation protein A